MDGQILISALFTLTNKTTSILKHYAYTTRNLLFKFWNLLPPFKPDFVYTSSHNNGTRARLIQGSPSHIMTTFRVYRFSWREQYFWIFRGILWNEHVFQACCFSGMIPRWLFSFFVDFRETLTQVLFLFLYRLSETQRKERIWCKNELLMMRFLSFEVVVYEW